MLSFFAFSCTIFMIFFHSSLGCTALEENPVRPGYRDRREVSDGRRDFIMSTFRYCHLDDKANLDLGFWRTVLLLGGEGLEMGFEMAAE